jgi:hypothetical protein
VRSWAGLGTRHCAKPVVCHEQELGLARAVNVHCVCHEISAKHVVYTPFIRGLGQNRVYAQRT